MKVSNPWGVKNQFLLIADNGAEIFQSYDSIIAKKEGGKIYLDSYFWDYSKTTGKYRNIFLGEKLADTQKKIESGEYILCNLNE